MFKMLNAIWNVIRPGWLLGRKKPTDSLQISAPFNGRKANSIIATASETNIFDIIQSEQFERMISIVGESSDGKLFEIEGEDNQKTEVKKPLSAKQAKYAEKKALHAKQQAKKKEWAATWATSKKNRASLALSAELDYVKWEIRAEAYDTKIETSHQKLEIKHETRKTYCEMKKAYYAREKAQDISFCVFFARLEVEAILDEVHEAQLVAKYDWKEKKIYYTENENIKRKEEYEKKKSKYEEKEAQLKVIKNELNAEEKKRRAESKEKEKDYETRKAEHEKIKLLCAEINGSLGKPVMQQEATYSNEAVGCRFFK